MHFLVLVAISMAIMQLVTVTATKSPLTVLQAGWTTQFPSAKLSSRQVVLKTIMYVVQLDFQVFKQMSSLNPLIQVIQEHVFWCIPVTYINQTQKAVGGGDRVAS